MVRRHLHLAVALGLSGVVAACADTTAPLPTSLVVADSIVLDFDSSTTLSVSVLGADARPLTAAVTFYSQDTAVATVDTAGLIHGVGLGVARVIVAADTLLRVVRVRVVTRVAEVALGGATGCLRGLLGDVHCWNAYVGEWPRHVPAARGLHGIVRAANRACGMDSAGAAWCWGTVFPGDGRDSSNAVPVRAAGAHRFTTLRVGQSQTCGLAEGGSLYCWGYNHFYMFTNGLPAVAATPVAVPGLQFRDVTMGSQYVCGITLAGTIHCWGNNNFSQTGITGNPGGCASDPCVAVPRLLATDSVFIGLAAGFYHTCALTPGGQAWCWGMNGSGQLGDSVSTGCAFRLLCSLVPRPVLTAARFSQLVAGDLHTCGLTPAGQAWCWGSNSSGKLGDGTGVGRPIPAPVAGNLMFVALSARGSATCGVTGEPRVYCWGSDSYNAQLNGPGRQDQSTPQPITLQP